MNDPSQSINILPPVIKTISVGLPVDKTFQLFTDQASIWWPLATHSVGGERVVACRMEGWAGGRFYEIQADGAQADWGQVLVWEPPQRVVFTLHPGRAAEFASLVEVVLQPEGSATRLTLTHTNWEACGMNAEAERQGYERGWDSVLKSFQAHVFKS